MGFHPKCYICDPLTGRYYSEESAYIESVERTSSDAKTPSLKETWDRTTEINDTYSEWSDAFEQSRDSEYLNAVATSGVPVAQEIAGITLTTKKFLDGVSNTITIIDTSVDYYNKYEKNSSSEKSEG